MTARQRSVLLSAMAVVLLAVLVLVFGGDESADDVRVSDGVTTTTAEPSTAAGRESTSSTGSTDSTASTAPGATTNAAASTTAAAPGTTTAGGPPATVPGTAPTSPPTTAPPTTSPPPGDLASARVSLTPVAGIAAPIAGSVWPGDGTLHIASRNGQVYALRGGSAQGPLLDISGDTTPQGERGLLGMTFSPDGGRLYVHFTDLNGDTRVDEWAVGAAGVPDPGSRRVVLTQPQPYANHNGGSLLFGPDGYLYLALGDGGSGGDPQGNGQNLGTILGKIVRIDPTPSGGAPYSIPPGNPFVGTGAREEIWIYGVRNPWRISFDRATGDLWVADVGQNRVEEVDWLPGGGRGANLGWNAFEGSQPFQGVPPPDAQGPLYEYGRDRGRAIVGGYVYRGSAIPALRGAYLFSDNYNGDIRALAHDGAVVTLERSLGIDGGSVTSFAEDVAGELYVLSFNDTVYRIDPA